MVGMAGSLMLPCLYLAWCGVAWGEDLVGIAVPGRVGTPELILDLADTDIGSGGGGSGDDWRVASANLAWDQHWIAAAIDYSVLTSRNPSRAPINWGAPDPYLASRQGSGRSDEVTASLTLRRQVDRGFTQAWIQAGPGCQIAGDLGGETLQNGFHDAIGNAPNDLPYEHRALRADILVHGGAGVRQVVGGPFALDLRSMGLLTSSGWSRYRAEALLFATAGASGAWIGVRQDGSAGHALTRIADAVAQHEGGLGIDCGISWAVQDLQVSLETYRDVRDDGQDGFVSLAYYPSPGSLPRPHSPDAQRWYARLALSGDDSLVAGHGTDVVLGTGATVLPSWMEFAIGFRYQDLRLPYSYDVTGRRLLLWGGFEAEPTLLSGPHASLDACIEAGIGVHDNRVSSHGFADVDGSPAITSYTPIVRAAAGLQATLTTEQARYGVALLGEATAAHHRQVVLHAFDIGGVVRSQRQADIDGSSLGLLCALSMSWFW